MHRKWNLNSQQEKIWYAEYVTASMMQSERQPLHGDKTWHAIDMLMMQLLLKQTVPAVKKINKMPTIKKHDVRELSHSVTFIIIYNVE